MWCFRNSGRRRRLNALRRRAHEIVESFDPQAGSGVFSTREQNADAWFLGSADSVRCFFEEDAFDDSGRLRQSKALSINKIGHALHERDPEFAAFSHGPDWAELASDLGLAAPQLWQSMFIFKQPGIGGEVRWHQDATFLHSDPITRHRASGSRSKTPRSTTAACGWRRAAIAVRCASASCAKAMQFVS